jgi:hypothetical protein
MNAAMLELSLHDGGLLTAEYAESAEKCEKENPKNFPGDLGVLGGEMLLGCALAV